MTLVFALLSGLLFGGGLVVSDMINPARVLGFLTIGPDWDPTLAFVMAGAMAPMFVAWIVSKQMGKPIAAPKFSIPSRSDITPSLIGGSILFGIGWGLVGFCPGPALAALVFEPYVAGVFVASMLAGMYLRGRLSGISA